MSSKYSIENAVFTNKSIAVLYVKYTCDILNWQFMQLTSFASYLVLVTTLIRQRISSCYCFLQWRRTKNSEVWLSRQHGYRRQKAEMCAYTHLHICTHSLFVNDSFCLAWAYSLCEDSGRVTVLSLEAMARATCKATDAVTGTEDSWAEKCDAQKMQTHESTHTHFMCTGCCCHHSKML